MKEYKDTNKKILKAGDVINIYQTVNGHSLFVILSLTPLDIRYFRDIIRKYEYDKEDLLGVCMYEGIADWEIVDNINDIYNRYKQMKMFRSLTTDNREVW